MSYKFVSKGWGWEKWIVNNDKYCGKLLYICKDKKLSLHYHKNKEETFYCQSGEVIVGYYDDPAIDEEFANYTWETIIENLQTGMFLGDLPLPLHRVNLQEGDSLEIPVGRRHFVYALRDSLIIEYSTHHEDSDSIRIIKGD